MLSLSGGGGVGLMGEGQSGVVSAAGIGGGGSGGSDGSPDTGTNTNKGVYGGGGYYAADGARGGVRIIWPGDVRYFPSTRTADE